MSTKKNTDKKKLKLNLAEVDGNAFAIIGALKKQAKIQGWSAEDIQKLSDDLHSSKDYDHLLQKAIGYTL